MQSLASLTSDLDRVYSKYIRLRDSFQGFGTCITCKTHLAWEDGDCGHFLSRRWLSTRYFELNTWLQCRRCNRYNDGEDEIFATALISKYGDSFIPWLINLKHQPVRFDRGWYAQQIEHYHQAVELLEKIDRLGGERPPELFVWNSSNKLIYPP